MKKISCHCHKMLFMIYTIFIFAIFNDILRIPDTSITLYRMSIPISILIILVYSDVRKEFLGIVAGLCLLTAIQKLCFHQFLYKSIDFSFGLTIKSLFECFSIILLYYLVKIINKIEGKEFAAINKKFILFVGIVLLINTYLKYLDSNVFMFGIFNKFLISNPNNYACYIVGVMPFIIFEEKSNLKKIILLGAALLILYIFDSKAALFGAVIQIVLWICLGSRIKKEQRIGFRFIATFICVVLVVGIIFSNVSINEYRIKDIVLQPIQRVLTNNPYKDYTVSRTYRVNTTIFCFNEMLRAKFIGIGAGSTSLLLKHAFPNLGEGYVLAKASPVLSLHNAWLEYALDFGFIMLIFYLIIIKYVIKLFVKKKELTNLECMKILFIVSFPVWVISASGINTLYYLFLIISYFLLARESSERTEKNEIGFSA